MTALTAEGENTDDVSFKQYSSSMLGPVAKVRQGDGGIGSANGGMGNNHSRVDTFTFSGASRGALSLW